MVAVVVKLQVRVGIKVQVRCVRVKGGDKGPGQVCKGEGQRFRSGV